jgi:hypothetical protein
MFGVGADAEKPFLLRSGRGSALYHADSMGNAYGFAFRLNWPDVINGWRTEGIGARPAENSLD